MLEQGSLGDVAGQAKRLFVSLAGLVVVTQGSQEMCAGCVEQVVRPQWPGLLIEFGQGGQRSGYLPVGDSAV